MTTLPTSKNGKTQSPRSHGVEVGEAKVLEKHGAKVAKVCAELHRRPQEDRQEDVLHGGEALARSERPTHGKELPVVGEQSLARKDDDETGGAHQHGGSEQKRPIECATAAARRLEAAADGGRRRHEESRDGVGQGR
jgi:hypothetical protein